MAYTAFEDMRLKNIDTYKIQTGPIQPYLTAAEGNGNDLKSAALRFIHNQCEKLNFDEKIAENEKNNRVLQGTGTDSGQIPYNMQMGAGAFHRLRCCRGCLQCLLLLSGNILRPLRQIQKDGGTALGV